MFFNVDRRFGLQTIHKCASTAIQNAFPQSGLWFSQVDVAAFMKLPHRVVLIRDPFKRAESAFRMYKRNGCSWRHELGSFPEFIHSICKPDVDGNGNRQSDGEHDPHTMSQWEHLHKGGSFTATEIVRWDFGRIAELLGIPLVRPDNVSYKGNNPDFRVECKWTDKAREAFSIWYAQDIDLWTGRIDCTTEGQLIDREEIVNERRNTDEVQSFG